MPENWYEEEQRASLQNILAKLPSQLRREFVEIIRNSMPQYWEKYRLIFLESDRAAAAEIIHGSI
jgi:hypothetical protein